MPLSEYNFEQFFIPQKESEGGIEGSKENKPLPSSTDKKAQPPLTPSIKLRRIKPEEAHQIGIQLLDNEKFKKAFKYYIGKLIINSQNLTRIDYLIDEDDDSKFRVLYGMTKEHFEDISNGNLSSFDLVADGPDLAITFKRKTGGPAIRPLDDGKLAELLNLVLKYQPGFAPEELIANSGQS